jgi:zinc transporter
VGGVPLANHPQGFWWVVALIVTFTLVAGYIAIRRQRE